MIIHKYKKYKKQYEKDKETNKSFDEFYRKSLQDNEIDKTESDSLRSIFTKYLDEMKTHFLYGNMEIKLKFLVVIK